MTGGAKCIIGGKTYVGRNIQVVGDKVIVDGVEQEGSLVGPINVIVHGDVDQLTTGSGDVDCDNVNQLTTSSGDVGCDNVTGNIHTSSGDVHCGAVGGNINTMSGDIKHR